MKPKEFLIAVDDARVTAAIQAAEAKTSGEIQVFISHEPANDPVKRAEAEFTSLGMTKTKERNGVLIFLAPASQTLAIIGDIGIHEKCGSTLWESAVRKMSILLRDGRY